LLLNNDISFAASLQAAITQKNILLNDDYKAHHCICSFQTYYMKINSATLPEVKLPTITLRTFQINSLITWDEKLILKVSDDVLQSFGPTFWNNVHLPSFQTSPFQKLVLFLSSGQK
jgi:hypothetical protein